MDRIFRPANGYFWKLKESELAHFVSRNDAKRIVERSLLRKPLTRDNTPVQIFLNPAKTIWVQSIQFYGGEHFGEPYCFVAEISHRTTRSAFSRWVNRCPYPEVVGRIAFTY